MYQPILCIIQQGIVPHQVVPHFSWFFTLFVAPVSVSQCIHLQCESARKHIRGYPLGTCTAFSSFKMQGKRAEPAETAHFSLVLYVKPLELEFIFGFICHKRISKGSGPD